MIAIHPLPRECPNTGIELSLLRQEKLKSLLPSRLDSVVDKAHQLAKGQALKALGQKVIGLRSLRVSMMWR